MYTAYANPSDSPDDTSDGHLAPAAPNPILAPTIRALIRILGRRKSRNEFLVSLLVIPSMLLAPFSSSNNQTPSPANARAIDGRSSHLRISANSGSSNKTAVGGPSSLGSLGAPMGAFPDDAREFYGGGNPAELLEKCNCGSKPVDATTGNFWHTFNDLSVPGRGVPLYLSRTYNSLAHNDLGPLGYGWTFNYNMFATRGLWAWTIRQENGSVTHLDIGGAHDPWVETTTTIDADSHLQSLTRWHDQIHFYFQWYDTGGYGINLLDHIVSRGGYTTTLSYEPVPGQAQPRVHSVTDPENRTITFYYTDTARPTLMTSAVDPGNRAVSFGYDANSNLTSVTDVMR